MNLNLTVAETEIKLETLTEQTVGNITIIPLKTDYTTNVDVLNLKKGIEMGLVNIRECNPSTVNEIIVENNAVTPLVLIDGEEIIGAKQNRIMNKTMLVPEKTTMKVPVSCTEHGRWDYTQEFKNSEYIANSNTRRAKAFNDFNGIDAQRIVWDSIQCLEHDIEFSSETSAMSESYDTLKETQNREIESFPRLENQTGMIIIIDNEIKGIEIFNNPQLYAFYHEKILKSYLIDSVKTDCENEFNKFAIEEFLDNISKSKFIENEKIGLGESYKFMTDYGIGSILVFENENVHMQYFKKPEKIIN